MNLEDDSPPAPAAPAAIPPAEPVAAVAPPAPEPEPEAPTDDLEDSTIIQLPRKALAVIRQENRELKEKAARADALQAQLNEAKPYVDFLKANPDLTRRPEPQAQQTEDPEALEAAQLMDFYTADGKPDLAKGAKHLAMVRKQAAQIAQQQMAPVAQTMAQQASERNFQMILNTPGANGVKPDPAIVRELWSRLPVQNTANDGVAWGIHAMAVGFTKPSATPVAPPPGPPVVTEASGGATKNAPRLSALERKVAENKGWTEEKMAQLTKDHTKGRTVVLED